MFVGCSATPEQKEKQRQQTFEQITAPAAISQWDMPTKDGKDDIFIVKDVKPIGETGVKNVVVERQRDNYLISGLSGKDVKVGSQVKLVNARRQINGNYEYRLTVMIE